MTTPEQQAATSEADLAAQAAAPATPTTPTPEAEATKSLEEMTSADMMNLSDEDILALENELLDNPAPAATPAEPAPEPAPVVADPAPAPATKADVEAQLAEELRAAGIDVPTPTQDHAPAPAADPAPVAKQEPTDAEKIAYLTGQLQALQNNTAQPSAEPTTPQEPPAPDLGVAAQKLENTINHLDENYRTERAKLAQMVDDGEINMSEYVSREQQLQDDTNGLKSRLGERLNQVNEQLHAPDPAVLERQILGNPALQQWTGELEAKNPWVEHLTPQMLSQLQVQAKQDMESMGLNTNTVDGVYNLRVRVVQLGQEMGYAAAFDPLVQAKQAQLNGGGAAPAAAPSVPATPLSNVNNQPTPAQRASKLELAANHPPSLNAAGVAMPTDSLATAHLEGMTASQLATALPSSTLDKLGEIA